MKRQICKARCTGSGSAMRSAKCSFEHAYVGFAINGVEYRWFNEDAAFKGPFKKGVEYDISFLLGPQESRTLQRVKVI